MKLLKQQSYSSAAGKLRCSVINDFADQGGSRPVGLCALINAENYKPKHLLAVDSIQSRLDLAKSLGAEPWNFQTDREGLDKRVKELTDGRGADVVIGRWSCSFPDSDEDLNLNFLLSDRGRWYESGFEDGFRATKTLGCHIECRSTQCRGTSSLHHMTRTFLLDLLLRNAVGG